MSTIVKIKDLGLAAFINGKGEKLVGCEGRAFLFECDATREKELRISYANSCCRDHDNNVMYLRTLLN